MFAKEPPQHRSLTLKPFLPFMRFASNMLLHCTLCAVVFLFHTTKKMKKSYARMEKSLEQHASLFSNLFPQSFRRFVCLFVFVSKQLSSKQTMLLIKKISTHHYCEPFSVLLPLPITAFHILNLVESADDGGFMQKRTVNVAPAPNASSVFH